MEGISHESLPEAIAACGHLYRDRDGGELPFDAQDTVLEPLTSVQRETTGGARMKCQRRVSSLAAASQGHFAGAAGR